MKNIYILIFFVIFSCDNSVSFCIHFLQSKEENEIRNIQRSITRKILDIEIRMHMYMSQY